MKKLTRRDVFGYLSSGGVGLAIGSAIDMGKATNPNPKILLLRGEVAQSFKDISALKAAKIMAPDGVAQVGGGEQAGNYKWLVGDYAAEVAGDPAGQEYIESSVVDATVGVWKKIDQGVVDRLAPAYLKTVSDIMNSGEVSLLRFIDRSKHSGLKDGTNTDDMAPAINEAMSSEARRLTMTWGSLNVAGTVEIPAKKQLVGSGRGETFIKALPGFSDSWVVRLGTSADQVVTGSRLENMTVSCNGLEGLVGVYSNSINENAGILHCAIRGVSKGLLINEANTGAGAGSPKNFIINGLEVFFDNADEASVGIDIVARYVQQMSAITVIGDFNAVVADAGIWIRSASGLDMSGVHLEGCKSGVRLGESAGGAVGGVNISSVTGPAVHPSVTDLVEVKNNSSQNYSIYGAVKAQAANTLKDDAMGVVLSDATVREYSVGAGSEDDRVIHTSSRNTRQRFNNVDLIGSIFNRVKSVGDGYTVQNGDRALRLAGTSDETITLPDATSAAFKGMELIVVQASGAGVKTVQATGANVLFGDGAAGVASHDLTPRRVYRFIADPTPPGLWFFSAG